MKAADLVDLVQNRVAEAQEQPRLPHADPTGFFAYMHAIVRMKYGAPGLWGRGKYISATRKGPGRRRVPLSVQNNPTMTKFVRRVIRHGRGEQTAMRRLYADLTGYQYGTPLHEVLAP